jgi:hypothetical protein
MLSEPAAEAVVGVVSRDAGRATAAMSKAAFTVRPGPFTVIPNSFDRDVAKSRPQA